MEFGTTVSLGAGERPAILALSTPDDPRLSGWERLIQCGAAALVDAIRAAAGPAPHDPADWAGPDDWLSGGTDLALPARTLRVVATPGHTRGHVVFVDGAAGLMFAGDHVLPHITPSIGLEPEAAALPLGDYLTSLRLVRSMPDQRLLPAHGPVSPSVHARVDELLHHHAKRLDDTWAAARDWASAYQVADLLTWTRRERRFADLDLMNQALAVSETAVHLDLLVAQGRLKSAEVGGVWRYDSA